MLVTIGAACLGFALLIWAAPLSVRYNAWTTGFRERNPNINPPPTPEMRALNTKIMTFIFRAVGLIFVLRSIIGLIGSFKSN